MRCGTRLLDARPGVFAAPHVHPRVAAADDAVSHASAPALDRGSFVARPHPENVWKERMQVQPWPCRIGGVHVSLYTVLQIHDWHLILATGQHEREPFQAVIADDERESRTHDRQQTCLLYTSDA